MSGHFAMKLLSLIVLVAGVVAAQSAPMDDMYTVVKEVPGNNGSSPTWTIAYSGVADSQVFTGRPRTKYTVQCTVQRVDEQSCHPLTVGQTFHDMLSVYVIRRFHKTDEILRTAQESLGLFRVDEIEGRSGKQATYLY